MKSLLYLGNTGRQLWVRDRQGWKPCDKEPDGPVWVITDQVDENFSDVTIPRVFGRDRLAVIERQLKNSFPDTPYRKAIRSAWNGKMGTLIDLVAPTRLILLGVAGARLNAELDATPAPIAGVWPMSLLLAILGQDRRLPGDLFVALPGPHALRIVFLKNHVPVLTRLVPTSGKTGAHVDEIVRTQRYVENLRLLQRGGQSHPILLLGDANEFSAPLAAAGLRIVNTPLLRDESPPADWRFPVFDLAMRSPPGQVAPLARRTAFIGDKLHKAALATAAASLLIALGLAAGNLASFFDTSHEHENVLAMIEHFNRQSNEVDRHISGFGVDPQLVRHAIALNDSELMSVPAFPEHLRHIAQAIGVSNAARLTDLKWHLLAPEETACAKTAPTVTAATAESAPAEQKIERKVEHKVEISFDLALPDDISPRNKADTLRHISARLETIPGSVLFENPVDELNRGTLHGGTAAIAGQKYAWCMTLSSTTPGAEKP